MREENKGQKKWKRSLVWIRRDLRIHDHRALYEACETSDEVVLAFVFDENILKKLPASDRRVVFIYDVLQDLKHQLKDLGSSLVILHGDPSVEITRVCEDLSVEAVFTNHDYEPAAKARDIKVHKLLKKQGRQLFSFKDQVIFEKLEVAKENGSCYRVYTPYKRAWLKKLRLSDYREFKPHLEKLIPSPKLKGLARTWKLDEIGFQRDSQLSKISTSGVAVFKDFCNRIDRYKLERDFPALDSTSRLSVHLRFGTISIRECVRECQLRLSKNLALGHDISGVETWLSEIIWREFYQMILDQFPSVVESAFLAKYKKIKWSGEEASFQAWCEGKTGYPLVDAAMRQLNQTGWMHNRLRMVVASFLVKDLLIDWRRGEKYFAEKLIDFDLAANNGGWQWCASTGCDAQPYFRIFNPIQQSLRFDPSGDFIRKYIPELRNVSGKAIHFPAAAPSNQQPLNFAQETSYPSPIVDHRLQKMKVLKLYRSSGPAK